MTSLEEKVRALSEEQTARLLGQEAFRIRVKEIVDEHIGQVEFMKKVREYAGMEIDSRMFTSFRYWLTLIATSAVTSLIGVYIGKHIQ